MCSANSPNGSDPEWFAPNDSKVEKFERSEAGGERRKTFFLNPESRVPAYAVVMLTRAEKPS